ncbi:MAG: efflux RND transporter periplasmic adaptor subunit [Verrucomicrobiota bacterium]
MNRTLFAILSGFTLVSLGACKKAAEPETFPPRPVKTAVVSPSASSIERSFSGQVQNAEGAPLAFESGGRVTQVVAKEGVRYEKGAVLAEVDETTYRSALQGAEAALTNARQELRRTQQLFETNNASQASLEAAVAAEASARASFEQAEKALLDVVLKMPYDGVIGRVDLEAQQVVSAGQEVMTIQGESGKEFEIGVTPDDISKLEVGLSGRLRLGALPDSEIAVEISEISPEVNENATYSVTFALEAASKDDPNIRAGMDGEVDVDLPNPEGEVLRVPIEAIASSAEGQPFVWTISPIEASPGTATVTKRFLSTKAMAAGGMIEVTEGLSAGELIVTRGVNSLDEEMVVTLLD